MKSTDPDPAPRLPRAAASAVEPVRTRRRDCREPLHQQSSRSGPGAACGAVYSAALPSARASRLHHHLMGCSNRGTVLALPSEAGAGQTRSRFFEVGGQDERTIAWFDRGSSSMEARGRLSVDNSDIRRRVLDARSRSLLRASLEMPRAIRRFLAHTILASLAGYGLRRRSRTRRTPP